MSASGESGRQVMATTATTGQGVDAMVDEIDRLLSR
jgi:hypothetical protein